MLKAMMVVCSAALLHSPTSVDFKIDRGLATITPPGPIELHPVDAVTSVSEAGTEETETVATPAPAPIVKVTGFGKDIPLEFAVRQIVPARVRIVYDQGVDRDKAVTWHGGRSWQQTLKAVAVSAGLHVTTAAGRIHLSR